MKNIFKKRSAGASTLFATGFQPLTNNPNAAPTLTGVFKSGDLASFFNAAFTLAVSLGAILAVLRIAYAGWMYAKSGGSYEKVRDAKEMVQNAIIGLLLLLGIWIILNQINPCLLDLNILRDVNGSSDACTGTSGASSTQTYTPSTETIGQNVVQEINVTVPAGTLNVNGQPVDQNGNPITN